MPAQQSSKQENFNAIHGENMFGLSEIYPTAVGPIQF